MNVRDANQRIAEAAASASNDTSGAYLGKHKTIAAIRQYHNDLVRIRHTLHENPELGYEEFDTAELVARELAAYGVDEIHREIGVTGVVGVIHGSKPASGEHRSIGLRADMDALPMQEQNDFAHRSKKAGVMHGCGHDGHTTMLLGAARYLAKTRQFSGSVNLIFQPGEEGHAGARAMINDGLFDRFDCDGVFAMHNWPGLPVGTIAMRPGPIMAAADRISIDITGVGGHGAHPDMTIDPVIVAAHIITAVQSVVSRSVNPIDSAVVSLCAMQAGDLAAMSVVPPGAKLTGTVRTFNAQTQDTIEKKLTTLVESIAAGFGATAVVEYEKIYPATINSKAEALFAADVARDLVGTSNVIEDLDPSMGAEDFSFMLQQKPGAYFRVGQGGEEGGCFLHNTRYDFNDNILPMGSALYARLAENWLS